MMTEHRPLPVLHAVSAGLPHLQPVHDRTTEHPGGSVEAVSSQSASGSQHTAHHAADVTCASGTNLNAAGGYLVPIDTQHEALLVSVGLSDRQLDGELTRSRRSTAGSAGGVDAAADTLSPRTSVHDAIMQLAPGRYAITAMASQRSEMPQLLVPECLDALRYETYVREIVEAIAYGAPSTVIVGSSGACACTCGLQYMYGFQQDGVRAAVEALVNDLATIVAPRATSADASLGGDAHDATTRRVVQAVALLHADTFANMRMWAAFLKVDSSTHALDIDIGTLVPATSRTYKPQEVLRVRLTQLLLQYAIRNEIGALRFCPECVDATPQLQLWLSPPVHAHVIHERMETATYPAHYSFLEHTSKPLYAVLVNSAAATPKGAHAPNFDDFNEAFWASRCLQYSYDYRSTTNIMRSMFSSGIAKTFPERSSYISLLLAFYPIFVFIAVHAHVCIAIASAIVDAGGDGFGGIGMVSPLLAVQRATLAILTLSVLKAVHPILALLHDSACASRSDTAAPMLQRATSVCRLLGLAVYQLAWAAAFFTLAFLPDGVWEGAMPLFYGLIGARMALIAIANGVLHPVLRTSYVLGNAESVSSSQQHVAITSSTKMLNVVQYVSDAEKVHTSIPVGAPMGGNLLRQPARYIFLYVLLWTFVVLLKTLFDIHIAAQTVSATNSLTSDSTFIGLAWGATASGLSNLWIVILLWLLVGLLMAVDSYIVFAVITPVVGAVLVYMDGIGHIRTPAHALSRLRSSLLHVSLAQAFVRNCLPSVASVHAEMQQIADSSRISTGASQEDAYVDDAWVRRAGSSVSDDVAFAPAWNGFIQSMRNNDLLSNLQRDALVYGAPVVVGDDAVMAGLPLIVLGNAATSAINIRMVALSELQRGDNSNVLLQHSDAAAVFEALHALQQCMQFGLRVCAAITTAPLPYIHQRCSVHTVASVLKGSDTDVERLWRTAHAFMATLLQPTSALFSDAPSAASLQSTLIAVLQAWGQIVSTYDAVQAAAGLQVATPRSYATTFADVCANSTGVTQAYERMRPCVLRARALMAIPVLAADAVVDVDATIGALVPEARRRIVFFTNSMYMRSMPRFSSSSAWSMTSFAALTPHYAEPVLYEMEGFVTRVNEHGVSPLVYLKSLHPEEWNNFKERMGIASERELEVRSHASLEYAVRMWASRRGQTLARTVQGVMTYAEACRTLASVAARAGELRRMLPMSQLQRREYAARVASRAAASADWWTAMRISYACACQKYSDGAAGDVARRVDIDALLQAHPLLSVVYFGRTADGTVTSECVNGLLGVKHAIRGEAPRHVIVSLVAAFPAPLHAVPGNAIADGIGEGKPVNQDNAHPHLRAHVIQAIDMNQDAYVEESYKLQNALSMFDATRAQPVALLGMREHIFTDAFSSSSLFMSYQEVNFGVVWQRVMASPLRVRLFYGHPDMMNRVFFVTRGGIAKASKVLNVSEDVFAGITATLRGGVSTHSEFMQLGKGRDIGMLQIAQFEAKVAGGSAISMTTRDAVRVCNSMEFFRALSLWHTWAGYYIVNVLIVLASLTYIWYLALLGISGAGSTLIGASDAQLLNASAIALFTVQIGALWYAPMLALLVLEYGVVDALWRMAHLLVTFGPLFYVAEMATKAFYFDSAISHGKTAYIATGRAFVIAHVPFHDIYRNIAASHLYLGFETLLLLILVHVFMRWTGFVAYVFLLTGTWIFALALLFTFLWFNPFALDGKYVLADVRAWLAWLRSPREDAHGGAPESSYDAWFYSIAAPYATTRVSTRVWHTIRLLRWAVLAVALLLRPALTRQGSTPALGRALTAAGWLIACCAIFAAVAGMHVVARKRSAATAGPGSDAASTVRPHRRILLLLHLTLALVLLAVVVLLIIFGATLTSAQDGLTPSAVLHFAQLLAWEPGCSHALP